LDLDRTDQLTPQLTQQIQAGARALLLADTPEAIPNRSSDPLVIEPLFPYARLVPRQHTVWEGNWASTLAWLRSPSFSDTAIVLDEATNRPYNSPPLPGNPRKTEAWALMQAAQRLKAARDSGDSEAIRDAVRLNWRLWTIFQADLLDPQRVVPADIRGNVLSLANFVDKHSVDVIGRPAAEKVDILITINRELAAGLFTEVATEAAAITAVERGMVRPGGDRPATGLRIST